MGLYSGWLIIGGIFASGIWGAYFWEGLFLGGLIIGILRYSTKTFDWVPLLEVLEKEGPQIEGYWQLVRGLFRFHACADNLNFVIIEDLKLS